MDSKYSDVEGIQVLNIWQSFWMHVLNTIYQEKQGQWMCIGIRLYRRIGTK